MKKHAKIVFKEFGSSFGRFMAIVGIIALGLAFVIGITAATPDIKTSFTDFFNRSALYDFYLYPAEEPVTETVTGDVGLDLPFGRGTIKLKEAPTAVEIKSGFSEEDMATVDALSDVDRSEAIVWLDAYLTVDGKHKPTRFYGTDGDLSVNKLTLTEGRLPASPAEAVAIVPFGDMEGVKVGDKLTVREEDRTATLEIDSPEIDKSNVDLSETSLPPSFLDSFDIQANVTPLEPITIFETTEFEIVGLATTPLYYSFNNETCSLGDGSLDYILFTQKEAFGKTPSKVEIHYPESVPMSGNLDITLEVTAWEEMRTTVWLTAKGSSAYTAFTKPYDTFSSSVETRIKEGVDNGWTVLDRGSNLSYYSLELNADKVSAIAGIFPIFFIAVAALVAFSTIVRMVSEDRGQIGTLRSLGFGNGQIIGKYMFYGLAACLLGILIGVPLGMTVLPIVIFNAYGSLYVMPAFVLTVDFLTVGLSCGLALIGTALVTVLACVSTLRETPAAIMQPKAPKAGKRILLERIPLWKHLPFKYKATFRNIFRFKRNFIMTVLAVAGCSALILAGFGMQNSTAEVTKLQFGQIYQFDLTLGVEADYASDGTVNEFLNEKEFVEVRKERGNLSFDGKSETVHIVVGDDTIGKDINKFFAVDEKIDKDSVYLSKGLADEFGVREGTVVQVENASGNKRELTVNKVVTMYSESWLLVGTDAYEAAFGEGASAFNTLFVRSGVTGEEESETAEKLLASPAVTGVTFTSSEKALFDNLSEMLSLVVMVLIVCAGALVIIVLYNLTNINIGERKKEIATLKVLGYRKGEVAGYVFREIFILVFLGIAVGIGLGWGLLAFILNSIQNPFMLFPSVISWWSYLVTFGLTLLFSGLVDLMLLPKLNRIDMADSMKAVE